MSISCHEKQENYAAGKEELFDENKDTDKEDLESIDVEELSVNREGIVDVEDSSSEEHEVNGKPMKEDSSIFTNSLYDDKANFVAMLKWLRWKVYQKLMKNTLSSLDVDKYNELVWRFVNKFKITQLTVWETSVWLRKIFKPKNDVRNYEISPNVSDPDINEQEINHSDLNEAEVIEEEDEKSEAGDSEEDDNITENSKALRDAEAKDDPVDKFFDNSKAYESLCDDLPSVIDGENPDNEIEEKLIIKTRTSSSGSR